EESASGRTVLELLERLRDPSVYLARFARVVRLESSRIFDPPREILRNDPSPNDVRRHARMAAILQSRNPRTTRRRELATPDLTQPGEDGEVDRGAWFIPPRPPILHERLHEQVVEERAQHRGVGERRPRSRSASASRRRGQLFWVVIPKA